MVLMVPLLIMATSLVSKINTSVAFLKGWVNSFLAFMGQLYLGFYNLDPFSSAKRSLRQILLTLVALLRREQDRLVRVLHHHQRSSCMAGLPSALFAALFSQALGFAHRLLETVGRWWLTTVVAVFGRLSFQLLDAGVGLFIAFQGFCQVVAQGLIFCSLRFKRFYQFFNVHEDTLPNSFLALNPFAAFVLKGLGG